MKGCKETSGSDGYVHNLDCNDGFMAAYIGQNWSNWTL